MLNTRSLDNPRTQSIGLLPAPLPGRQVLSSSITSELYSDNRRCCFFFVLQAFGKRRSTPAFAVITLGDIIAANRFRSFAEIPSCIFVSFLQLYAGRVHNSPHSHIFYLLFCFRGMVFALLTLQTRKDVPVLVCFSCGNRLQRVVARKMPPGSERTAPFISSIMSVETVSE